MKYPELQLNFLDHVAITVEDIDRSAAWYSRVLGLRAHTFAEWGDYPVFMLCGKTGVAIFPAEADNAPVPAIRIHHFAFNVDRENFNRARRRYEDLNIRYDFQDHHFFHSIYTFDPDGHRVELTCIQVPEADFYK